MEYLINIYENNECWMTVVFVPSLESNFLENYQCEDVVVSRNVVFNRFAFSISGHVKIGHVQIYMLYR